MSNNHIKKLEAVLDLLINEEDEKAEELLHSIMVEKARGYYETLVQEDEEVDESEELEEGEEEELEESEEEELDETVGGDSKMDFADEIRADMDEIESDETYEAEDGEEAEGDEADFEADDDFEGEEGEEDTESRLSDLEAALAELEAEFEMLKGEELEEPEHSDLDMDADGEFDAVQDMEFESLGEATKLQDKVSDPGMGQEGKLAGTGKNSKTGSTDKKSMYTNAPSKVLDGADPVDFTKGGEGESKKVPAPQKGGDFGAKDNIDVDHKKAPAAKTKVEDDKSAKSTISGKKIK